ncbi:MAG: 16S rRNA (cytosine(1402)-N(4))-methyltransferase RsmH [Chitinophagales bacterium]|nr:16S rRNA (cytosine(1402)-N(4))-methyltransferase RsmH [Chitinophagales bacterium]
MEYHKPVLLNECIDGLNIKEDGVYIDATFGGGGHSRAILERLNKNGKLIGFDQDEAAWQNQPKDERFIMIKQNFRHLQRFLKLKDILSADGILADLGVSSYQFDTADRGFSTRFDGPLDMRMNAKQELSALDVVNNYNETQLLKVFSSYGEVRNSRQLAKFIVEQRRDVSITTTKEFADLVSKRAIGNLNKYLSQVFQAIRIEVNDEINALKDFLKQSVNVLNSGGRLVVLSYHSLEDRLVKNVIRWGDPEVEPERDVYGKYFLPLKAINKKLILPSEEEMELNSRARSAKLRIAEKV